MRILNPIFILIISGLTGFLSMALWLGTVEDKAKLEENFIIAFISRFGAFSLLGFLGILVLISLNYILNSVTSDNTKKTNLKKLTILGCIATISTSLLGTILFFF